jgi:hypothetical protein
LNLPSTLKSSYLPDQHPQSLTTSRCSSSKLCSRQPIQPRDVDMNSNRSDGRQVYPSKNWVWLFGVAFNLKIVLAPMNAVDPPSTRPTVRLRSATLGFTVGRVLSTTKLFSDFRNDAGHSPSRASWPAWAGHRRRTGRTFAAYLGGSFVEIFTPQERPYENTSGPDTRGVPDTRVICRTHGKISRHLLAACRVLDRCLT